jgi:hypothetical protein
VTGARSTVIGTEEQAAGVVVRADTT